ncbi:STAS domain-containing protein [Ectothiorhodospiraceae bacterium WFHF3C12]|nr:STAS domain-containing protein [Ectothiorhodospiraceae bacterium WFHF3C12]
MRRGETEGQFVLEGNLSIESVPRLWERTNGAFHDVPALTIDLGQVERADSAGLALLIDWTRRARDNGQDIRFTNLPDQMLAIARVSGLDTMLPFYRAD